MQEQNRKKRSSQHVLRAMESEGYRKRPGEGNKRRENRSRENKEGIRRHYARK